MAILLAGILATLHLENDDLVTLYEWVHYFYYYLCTFNLGCADGYCSLVVYEQHLVEFNSLAGLYILDVVHEELLALLSLELLTVNFYDCVHFLLNINGFFRKANDCNHCFFEPPRSISGAKLLKKNDMDAFSR